MKNLFLLLTLLLVGANTAQRPPLPDHAMQSLKVQVLLDRQNFSPGEIDASPGTNTRRALNMFQTIHNLQPTVQGQPDEQTLKLLEPRPVEALAQYTITEDDVKGPFAQTIPKDFNEQAKLKGLSYTSPLELLSEKFHSSPELLKKLNPHAEWEPGETIQVPNIDFNPPSSTTSVRVIVTETTSSARVEDANQNVIFYAPVTAGSERDPLPLGTWKVVGISRNPKFHYNPDLFWDAKATDEKTTLPPGPNNPVGVVWIDLNAPHYGLHGTPEPSKIAYSESHGCVRFTNWDALRVAALVHTGTPVVFEHEPSEVKPQSAPETQPQSSVKLLPKDILILRQKMLLIPVQGVKKEVLVDSFNDARGSSRKHEAIDILAPRRTPVLAVEDGRIARLWYSVPGGITIYQFDPTETYAYYYAHLDSYAPSLKEGNYVHRSQVIGFVGTTGNAPDNTPHLHFSIFKLTPQKHWWEGQPIDPYYIFKG